MKNKVLAMMHGIAIGDALGRNFENQPALGYPITYYSLEGQTTDDWQLSSVVAKSLMSFGGFSMSDMAAKHVEAYDATTYGWGRAHRDACKELKNGTNFADSGKKILNTQRPFCGRGNGMCMKISPLAAYQFFAEIPLKISIEQIRNFSDMTHATAIGYSSAVAMCAAIKYCLKNDPSSFDARKFINSILKVVLDAEWNHYDEISNGFYLSDRLKDLLTCYEKLTPEKIAKRYKGGGYVYQSFPFALAFFCLGNHDVSCIYDCVGSGGDTDTNASMVGAMVGALHGSSYPASLLTELKNFDEVAVTSQFFADFCKKMRN